MVALPPEGHMISVSSPDDITLYPTGTSVQLIRRCMLPAIPVGAIGVVIPPAKDENAITRLLMDRGKYLKVDFDLSRYNVEVVQEGGSKKVDRCIVYCGTDEIRPYDPNTYTDFIIMCVGNPLEEHVYAYYRPEDFTDPEWQYSISFGEKSVTHHYFKATDPQTYMIQYQKDLAAKVVQPVPIRLNQPFSPFQK